VTSQHRRVYLPETGSVRSFISGPKRTPKPFKSASLRARDAPGGRFSLIRRIVGDRRAHAHGHHFLERSSSGAPAVRGHRITPWADLDSFDDLRNNYSTPTVYRRRIRKPNKQGIKMLFLSTQTTRELCISTGPPPTHSVGQTSNGR